MTVEIGIGLNLRGTRKADVLDGSNFDDVIKGLARNDLINGHDGNDLLNGGKGADIINGGMGDDYILGGRGHDQLFGDEGNDILHGGKGNDLLNGGANDDLLAGELGNDDLFGGSGSDILFGGAGFDTLTGGEGNDIFLIKLGETGSGPGFPFSPDRVLDFNPEEDNLMFDLGGAPEFLLEAFLFIEEGDDLVIYFNDFIDIGDPRDEILSREVPLEEELLEEELFFGIQVMILENTTQEDLFSTIPLFGEVDFATGEVNIGLGPIGDPIDVA